MSSSATQPSQRTLASSRPVVLCGPSGVGKSTLLKRLFDEFPGQYGFSVSHTTRAPRPGEQDGISYHFVDRLQFEDLVAKGAFLEHAQFGGNLYGTTAKAVQDVSTQTGKRAILDIDAQGVKLLKANHSYLAPLYLFISPPTLSALHSRLKSRGTETPSSIYHRLSMAAGEMSYAREAGQFEVVIVNDDLQRAYELFRSAVRSEDSASVRGDVVPPEEKEGDVLGTAKKEMEQEAKQ